MSTTAPFVSTEDSQPVYENNAKRPKSKNDRSHSLEARGSLIEPESDLPRQKANRKRGETRGKGRKLRYLDGGEWVPATYHHIIREFLIQKASENGEYTYPRERGPGRDDVTSFLESQKDWGPERDKNWADILYVFQKDKNHKDPSYELKTWMFNGKIVLSAYDDRPIRLFRDLPDTLSSALHGRDMEAMKRTDPRIQQRDFMVRMPLRHTTVAGTRRPLQSASSIGMRMTRFRQQQGLLSWTGRDGSQTIRDALWERLPPENKRANSVRGLKPPSITEQQEIKKGNAGKFLNRAGRRALTSEERERRKQIAERRLKQRRERELGTAEARVSDETIKGRRQADGLGGDGVAQPDGENSEQYARQGIPLYDGTAGGGPTGNLGVDGLAEFDVEQGEHRLQRGRPNNGTGEPYEERAKKQNELKRRLRERQEVSLGGGISDDNTRVRRPVNILNADGLAGPDPEQNGYNTRPDRPDNRSGQPRAEQAKGDEMLDRREGKLQDVQKLRDGIPGDNSRGGRPVKIVDTGTLTEPITEQSQDQAGIHRPNKRKLTTEQIQDQAELHRPNKRFMQSPQTNNNLPEPGKDTHQPEQCYNQVGNPSEGGNNTDYNDDLFGSDLPAPPRDFDLEAYINEFQAKDLNFLAIPSPPLGCDVEQILKGLSPTTFMNTGDSPSTFMNTGDSPSSPKSNQPSPDKARGFDDSLSESQAESADQRRALPNEFNYPPPPDYSLDFEGPLDGESQAPYFL